MLCKKVHFVFAMCRHTVWGRHRDGDNAGLCWNWASRRREQNQRRTVWTAWERVLHSTVCAILSDQRSQSYYLCKSWWCCGGMTIYWWMLWNCHFCAVVVAFSLHTRIGREIMNQCQSVPFFCLIFFFLMEISLRTPVPLFKPGLVDDGLDSWVNYGWAFPDKCFLWAGFPDSFHCVPGQQSQPTQTLLGEGRMGVMV